MAEAEPWVFDAVQGFLKGPEWSVAIWDFIDDNCIVFDSEDENKLAYHDIFNSFRELVDGLLTYHLEDLSISQESFAKLCAEYGSTEAGKDTLEQILAVDDFVSFKQMMVKRNIELELESLKELQALSEGVKNGEIQAEPEAEEDDFEEQMRKAIANSLVDGEAGVYTDVSDTEIEKLREEQEAADIKMAIAMSIQMEEQELKEQNGEQKPVALAPVETRPPAPTPAPAPAPPPKQHRMAPVKAPLGALAPLPMPRQTPYVSQAPTSTQLAAQEQYQRAQESAAAAREEAQKAKEAQQQQMLAAGGGASAAEVRARAEHLKKQRDLILAKRKKERGESVVQSEPAATPASSNASVPPSSALRQGAGYSNPDPHAAAKAQLSVQLASSMKSALLGEDSTTLDLQTRMQKDARKVDLELTKQQLREEAQANHY